MMMLMIIQPGLSHPWSKLVAPDDFFDDADHADVDADADADVDHCG